MADFEPNARVFTAFACELSRGPPTGLRRTIIIGNLNRALRAASQRQQSLPQSAITSAQFCQRTPSRRSGELL